MSISWISSWSYSTTVPGSWISPRVIWCMLLSSASLKLPGPNDWNLWWKSLALVWLLPKEVSPMLKSWFFTSFWFGLLDDSEWEFKNKPLVYVWSPRFSWSAESVPKTLWVLMLWPVTWIGATITMLESYFVSSKILLTSFDWAECTEFSGILPEDFCPPETGCYELLDVSAIYEDRFSMVLYVPLLEESNSLRGS